MKAVELPEAYVPLLRSVITAAAERRIDRDLARDLVETALRAGSATVAVAVSSRRVRRLAVRGGVAMAVLGVGVTAGVLVARRRRRQREQAAAEAHLDARAAQVAAAPNGSAAVIATD